MGSLLVKEFDVALTGYVQEKWDKFEKKTKQRFFVNRSFRYPDLPEDLETIDDSVIAGKNIDEAIEILEAQREHFEFFKRYDLIDTGRYWLNRDLKRCFVDEGRVVVIDFESDSQVVSDCQFWNQIQCASHTDNIKQNDS